MKDAQFLEKTTVKHESVEHLRRQDFIERMEQKLERKQLFRRFI